MKEVIKLKKIFGYILMITVFMFLVACGSESSSTNGQGDGETIKLLFNNHAPATHHVNVNAFEPWAELVKEKTDGRVEVEVHSGASLGGSLTVFDDVKGGVYDITFAPSDYIYDTAGFPWSIAELPFVYSDPLKTRELVSKVVEKFGVDKLNEEVKYLGTTARDPYILVSTKEIHSIEDVQGLNIIVPGRITAGMIEAWGATPVSIEHNESYEALQRGTADAISYSGASSGKSGMQYYEVAPYFVENMTIANGSQIMIMNKEKFESLPEDIQELFENELGPALGEMVTQSYANEKELYPDKFEDDEVTFINLPEEEIQKFSQYGKEAWDEWVKMADERGYPGQEMVDYLVELLEADGVNVDFLK